MVILQACGRVTNDLELQMGQKNLYVQFSLAVTKGYGEGKHTVFLECWGFGDMATRLTKGGVKKGSVISLTGQFDLVEIKRKDGSKDRIPKVTVLFWEYPPISRPQEPEQQPQAENVPLPEEPPVIDGEHDQLP